MPSRRSQSGSRMSSSVMQGVGVSVSLTIVLASGGVMPTPATAAPLFPSAVESAQTTPPGTTSGTSSSDDVIVNTEGQATTSTPGSTTSSSTTPGSTTPNSGTSTSASTRFTCQASGSQYMVMYHPESQPGQSYAWANPTSMGGGWTPERRCNEISRRLESYRPDGLLEMRTAVENGYNTVCVTTQSVPSCRIVLTVPAGQDPIATRDSVFQNLSIADSGRQTQAVNTYVGGNESGIIGQIGQVINGLPGLDRTQASNGIDLRPFLDRADGGTAQNLRRGVSNRPSPRLNPNNFK